MENDFFAQVSAYFMAFIGFVSGLLIQFKEADKKMKVVYLIGGFIVLAVVLSVLQAAFG